MLCFPNAREIKIEDVKMIVNIRVVIYYLLIFFNFQINKGNYLKEAFGRLSISKKYKLFHSSIAITFDLL